MQFSNRLSCIPETNIKWDDSDNYVFSVKTYNSNQHLIIIYVYKTVYPQLI